MSHTPNAYLKENPMFQGLMSVLNFVMEFVFGVFSRLAKYVFVLVFGTIVLTGSIAFLIVYAFNT